jgi:hypothetical protein
MKNPLWLIGMLLLSLFTACSDSEVDPDITLDSTASTLTFTCGKNEKQTVQFTATRAWTAASNAQWLSVSPNQGESGLAEVTITTRAENTTANDRTASVVLTCGTVLKYITVTQEAAAVCTPEQSQYLVEAAGGDLTIHVSSNVDIEELFAGFAEDLDWIGFKKSGNTRATMANYSLTLTVAENTSAQPRSCMLYFARDLGNNKTEILDAVEITQYGANSNGSEDYSADKTVDVLQTHSLGGGIPLVLMGDGFLDSDIESGYYTQVMKQTMENFFSEEPIRSLRDYFDVYQVNVVSANNVFGAGNSTALSCELAGGNDTTIKGDDDTVMDYVQAVTDIDYRIAQVIVVLNTSTYAGTTYYGYMQNGTYLDLSIAYCPTVNGVDSELYRTLVAHESVGHGLGKLADEYSYESMGEIAETSTDRTEVTKEYLRNAQARGWSMNVDIVSDPATVLWHTFLEDSRYDGQGLGVYEGGLTYWKGVYRPTEDGMMNTNIEHFNAPSRQQLYLTVMRMGMDSTPSYEEFVTFDQAHPYDAASATTKATALPRAKWAPRLPHPVCVNRAIH